jgi:plasmid stabilization system protein ParE
MKQSKIRILPAAQFDIREIVDALTALNPAVSVKFADRYAKVQARLRDFPESAPIAKDSRLAENGFRIAVLEYGYLMFYKVQDETVWVHRVIRSENPHRRVEIACGYRLRVFAGNRRQSGRTDAFGSAAKRRVTYCVRNHRKRRLFSDDR